jgi:MFS family permease
MLAAPTVTVLARKLGIQLPMLIGAAMLSGGFISASFASHIWHLYLSQGALVGLGVGFIYVPSMAILPQWFVRSRSLANGISAAGSGIGGLIFSLATGAMIENIGLESLAFSQASPIRPQQHSSVTATRLSDHRSSPSTPSFFADLTFYYC